MIGRESIFRGDWQKKGKGGGAPIVPPQVCAVIEGKQGSGGGREGLSNPSPPSKAPAAAHLCALWTGRRAPDGVGQWHPG